MSSSPRITFQSKIDEKVQSHPPFRCRVGHRIILQMGLSSVGRRKRETVGAETTACYYKTTHIIAIGLSSRTGERTIGCFHSAFDHRALSRPLHGYRKNSHDSSRQRSIHQSPMRLFDRASLTDLSETRHRKRTGKNRVCRRSSR